MSNPFYIKSGASNIFNGGYSTLASLFAKQYSSTVQGQGGSEGGGTEKKAGNGLNANPSYIDGLPSGQDAADFGNIDIAAITKALLASLGGQQTGGVNGVNSPEYSELVGMQGTIQTASSLLNVGKNSLSNMTNILNQVGKELNSLTSANRNQVQKNINNLVQDLFLRKNSTIFNGSNIFGDIVDIIKNQTQIMIDKNEHIPPTINNGNIIVNPGGPEMVPPIDTSKDTPPPEANGLKRSQAIALGYTIIESVEDFKKIATDGLNDSSKKYILMADIDLSGVDWQSIGTASNAFKGEFNGNGYKISNLTVNSNSNDKGLFGYTDGAAIRNVKLESGNVTSTGGSNVGALVGYAKDTLITNVYSKVNVNSTNSNNVGALVGNGSGGTISNSYSTGDVVANGTVSNIGGFVGNNKFKQISNSYSTGNVTATNGTNVGGFAGYNSGTILNVYTKATVNGKTSVGALVGANTAGSHIENARYLTQGAMAGVVGFEGAAVNPADVVNVSGLAINEFTSENLEFLNKNEFPGAGAPAEPPIESDFINSITRLTEAQAIAAGYTVITVQPWGTGEDDCLSRIIEKHYGVSAYSEEGQEIMQKVIEANPQIYNSGRKTIQNGAIADAKPNSPETLLYAGDKVNLPGGSSKVKEDPDVPKDNSTDGNENGELNPDEKDIKPTTPTLPKYSVEENQWDLSGNEPVLKQYGEKTTTETGKLTEAEAIAAGYTVVKTAAELKAALTAADALNNANKKIMLFGDINLDDLGVVDGNNWTAIGTDSSNSFRGTFDGNGYTISNLKINKTNSSAQGFFGVISGATIKNVGLENVDVKGNNNTGGLVGYADGANTYRRSTISNSYTTGNVTTAAASGSGGLVGTMAGDILNSYSSANVTGGTSGGLVGHHNSMNTGGLIKNSYATGNVNGTGNTGGLVGYAGANIENSYATGNVTGAMNVGGLVGHIAGDILNSYSSANVFSASGANTSSRFGGLVGYYNSNTSVSISNSYSSGQVKATVGNRGGFIGQAGSGTINNYAYATQTTSGVTNGSGIAQATGTISGTLQTSGQNKNWFSNATNLKGILNTNEGMDNWDYSGDTPLLIKNKEKITTLIKNKEKITTNVQSKYNITEAQAKGAGYIGVSTAQELYDALHSTDALNNTNKKIILLNDIDLNDLTSVNGSNWIAVGTSQDNSFRGTFDGNGFKISNMSINSSNDYQGFFGYTDGATIKNVGLENVDVKGGLYQTGGLVGHLDNSSVVQNSYSTGSVNGNNNTGGLIGIIGASSVVQNSYSKANVTGGQNTGGLTGTLDKNSTLENSYATGIVTGFNNVGGLVGSMYNAGATIKNSYSTGDIFSTSNAPSYANFGGLVGNIGNTNQTISNSYSTSQVKATIGNRGGFIGSVGAGLTLNINNYAYATQTTSGVNNTSGIGAASGTITGTQQTSGKAASWFKDTLNLKNILNAGEGANKWDYTTDTPTLLGNKVKMSEKEAIAAGYTVVKTAAELKAALTASDALNNANKKIMLFGDINLNELAFDATGSNWTAVGTGLLGSFKGTFDGNGHTISNLKINQTGGSQGLFGYTDGATIKNITVNGNVKGGHNTGALIGNANNTTISNAHIMAGVIGSAQTGGLVGNANNTTIINASVEGGVVVGTSSTGGLVGSGSGTNISNSYATTGGVNGTTQVGGLVGMLNNGTILNSYSDRDVTGDGDAGGLVGMLLGGNIESSYAASVVKSTSSANSLSKFGGFVGSVDGNSSILNSYSTGQVKATIGDRGGFIGKTGIGTLKLSNYTYADQKYGAMENSGIGSAGITKIEGTLQTGGKETPWFQNSANLQGILGAGNGAGEWDFSKSRPTLLTNKEIVAEKAPVYNPTSSTQQLTEKQAISMGYTVIKTVEDFNKIRNDLGGKYILMNDIDLSGINWEAIGTQNNAFMGEFNGNGHSISNLTINKPTSDNQGLFGYATDATIQNVNLVGGSVKGKNNVGALVGCAVESIITNTGSNVLVEGSDNVGGLVGYASNSHISLSFATKDVIGTGSNIGGLVGYMDIATIDQSYSMGKTTGNGIVGGLVGGTSSGGNTVTNSYATGEVSGNSNVGGFAGTFGGDIKNSYSFGNVNAIASNGTKASTIGGFIGYGAARVENSYSRGILKGDLSGSNIGGFMGQDNGGSTFKNTHYQVQAGINNIGNANKSGITAQEESWFNTASNILNVLNAGEGVGKWNATTGDGFANANLVNNTNSNLNQNLAGTTIINGKEESTKVVDVDVSGGVTNGKVSTNHIFKLLPDSLGGGYFELDTSLDFGDFGPVDYFDVLTGDDIGKVVEDNMKKLRELQDIVNKKTFEFTLKESELKGYDTQQKIAINQLTNSSSNSNSGFSELALLTLADTLQKLIKEELGKYTGSLGNMFNTGNFPTGLLSSAGGSGSGSGGGGLSKPSSSYHGYGG